MQNDFFGSGIGQLSLEETINQEIQKISRVNYKNKDLPDLPQNNITNLQISKSPIYTEGPTNTNIVVTQFGNIEEVKTERDQNKKITANANKVQPSIRNNMIDGTEKEINKKLKPTEKINFQPISRQIQKPGNENNQSATAINDSD